LEPVLEPVPEPLVTTQVTLNLGSPNFKTRTRTETRIQFFLKNQTENQILGSNSMWNQKKEGKENTVLTIHHFKD
jgi:hypothetical protein